MKARDRLTGILLATTVLSLGIVLGTGGSVLAAPQYAMDCTSCHQMPPRDSGTAKKNAANGAVPGNHQAHATAAKNSCVKCHGSQVALYATGHRTKVIQLLDTLGYVRKTSGVFMNQTSVPPNPLSQCSTALCHSNGTGVNRTTPTYRTTPNWANMTPATCDTCHDSQPATNGHSKHLAYWGSNACVKCHADHASEAKTFAHATSAGARNIDVHFTAAPNNGGTFAANQCSTLYCHSNGQTTTARMYATPNWGVALPADCTGCHGNATSNMLSGKHAQHANNAAYLGMNYGCVECHAATVSDNANIANLTKHVNGFVNLSGAKVPKSEAVAGSVTSCSTVYCHSNGKGTYKTITWTGVSTPLACNACHGSDTGAGSFASTTGMPNYSSAGAGALGANSHKTHVSALTDCIKCHNATVNASGALIGNHTNKNIDVSGTSFGYNSTSKSCSSNICHSGNGIIQNVATAQWGAKLGCNGCHGDASSLASNAHQKHVSALLGKGYACDTCHNQTVSGSSIIINKNLHGDGIVEIAGSSVTYTPATKTCATSCHLSATPQWNNPATGACGTCHNALSTTVGGLIATNAHSAHFNAAYGPRFDGASTNSCAVCHVYSTDTAVSHVSGTVDLGAGFAKNGTCSTCHQQTTNWAIGGVRLACESCHTTTKGPLSVISGITAPDKTLAASAGHGQTGINKACTDCHDNATAHIGVTGGTSRLQAALGMGNTACTYCHSDATKVTNTAKQITQVHAGFANTCSICHELHGTTNSTMVQTRLSSVTVAFSGADFVNAQGTGVCQACHTATTYYKRNVAESNHPTNGCTTCHPHKGFDGLTAFEPNRACDSCHGYPPAPRVTTSSVTFGVQGNWSSARFEDYSGGGGAHIVAAHLAQTIKPSDGWTPCLVCHNGGAATHAKALPLRNHVENVTVLVDPQYRFSNDYFITYTGARLVSGGANKTGSCFNVSCHFTISPKWSIER